MATSGGGGERGVLAALAGYLAGQFLSLRPTVVTVPDPRAPVRGHMHVRCP
jgi:uncharacterized protein YqgC (DUF456 family)